MAFSFTGFLKGILLQNEVDRSKQLAIQASSGATTNTTMTLTASQSTNQTLTLPDATDTLVGKATTDTLTNKSISGSTNTLTNISSGSLGTVAIAQGGTGQTTKAPAFDALQPMTTLGDTIYGGASGTGTRLAGSITAAATVLTQTGNGSVSAAPAWTATTGTGNAVLATAPTLTNPVVGTQTQLDGSTKAASTSYVDVAVSNAIAGVNPAVAVQAATTAASDTSGFTYSHVAGIGDFFTGAVNTAVTIDGFTFTTLNQRLLIKNDTQSPSGAYNGVYTVTQLQTGILAPVLTRALDFDTPSDINNTGAIPVVNGTVNATTSWVQTAQVVTVGTTPLVFAKFSRNPADYLLVANNLSDVNSKSTSFNNLSPMTTGGDLIYGGASGTGTRLANGTFNQVLTSAGGTTAPSWTTLQQGNKNYITFGTFENNATTGWSLGTVGTLTNAIPTGSPTFGSGASGNLSITTVSSGQLAGAFSLSYVSSAATTAGNMLASQAYTIDAEDQAKVLTFKFYYSAFSGTANANWSGTSSNSFGIAIYDVTNSSWLTSTANFGMTQGSGIGYVTGTCQTNATTASLRFVVYNANATSGAATIYFDDFSLGPQTAPLGSPISDWTSFTPTGSWSTNTTYTGWWKREGDKLSLILKLALAGAPTSASLTINLPTGLTIDTTKLPATPTNVVFPAQLLGQAAAHSFVGSASYSSTTALAALYYTDGSTASIQTVAAVTQAAPYTFANADFVYLTVSDIPISGWSSNVQMSNDTDTRVVAMTALSQTPTGTLTNSANVVKFGTVTNDTHAAYNTSTGLYTVPVTGWYSISSALDVARVSNTVGNAIGVYLYKNGSTLISSNFTKAASTSVINYIVTATGIVFCNAGDTLGSYSYADATTPTYETALGGSSLSINRLSGPSVIAVTESVNGTYTDTAGNSIGTSLATYTYATKVKDSHNAYSGGTLTIPVSGQYRFFAGFRSAGVTLTTSQSCQSTLLLNGATVIADDLRNGNGGTTQVYQPGCMNSYPCKAGDTVVVQLVSSVATTMSSSAGVNYFSWERVGN